LAPDSPSAPQPPLSSSSPSPPQNQPTPTQTLALVRNPAPIHGKRARTNSHSNSQTIPKKPCPKSSSTSMVLHSNHSTSSQPEPSFPPTSNARSRLCPRSLCIMTAPSTAPTAPEEQL
jgi:hypothetical protein